MARAWMIRTRTAKRKRVPRTTAVRRKYREPSRVTGRLRRGPPGGRRPARAGTSASPRGGSGTARGETRPSGSAPASARPRSRAAPGRAAPPGRPGVPPPRGPSPGSRPRRSRQDAIDEDAIRERVREAVGPLGDLAVLHARVRREIGAVLTPEQNQKAESLLEQFRTHHEGMRKFLHGLGDDLLEDPS